MIGLLFFQKSCCLSFYQHRKCGAVANIHWCMLMCREKFCNVPLCQYYFSFETVGQSVQAHFKTNFVILTDLVLPGLFHKQPWHSFTESFIHWFSNPIPLNLVVYTTRLLRLARCHLCHLRGVYMHESSHLAPPTPFFLQSCGASRWSICYQRSLRRRFFLTYPV